MVPDTMADAAAGAMDFISKRVCEERCVLFLGAAAHAGPPPGSVFSYPEDQRPPIGAGLSQKLAAASNFAATFGEDSLDNLQRVALHFEVSRSRPQLVEQIRDEVHVGKQPSIILEALAQLNFPIIITTNYDRLFERALERAGKEPIVSIYSPHEGVPTDDYPLSDLQSERPFVCKIHGDIQQPESIVVTDEDYIQFVLRMSDRDPNHPIPPTAKYHLQKWPTLFVGYSLLDYNLRLLFKTLRWKTDRSRVPDMYSVDLNPDPLILDVWYSQRRYVNFIVQDVWTFVPDLYRRVMEKELTP